MRSLALFKIFAVLVAVAACLVFSPTSKAQSEIAPDHFDGTDSWEAAARHKVDGSKSQHEGAATQANRHELGPHPTLLTRKCQTGTRSVTASTIQRRRKVLAENSKKTIAMR
jgi:hypothetical protein